MASVIIGGVVIYFAISSFVGVNKIGLTNSSRVTAETIAAGALAQIMETGRLAQKCWRGTSGELFCDINTSTPPLSGPDRHMRFAKAGTTLNYDENTSPGVWKNLMNFPEVVSFVVCDDATMTALNPTCPLTPLSISKGHGGDLTATVKPTGPNRFFRFQIQQKVSSKSESINFQSAFYVRTPVPVAQGTLVYQWGAFK